MTGEAALIRLRTGDEELIEVLRGYLDGAFLPCQVLPSPDPMFVRVVPLKNNAEPRPIELHIPTGSVLCIATGQDERLLGFVAAAQATHQSPAGAASGQGG